MSSNLRLERVCKHCGDTFIAKTTTTKYCGDSCAKRAYKRRKQLEQIVQSDFETLIQKLTPILEIQQKHFLSVNETIQLLGLSEYTVRKLLSDGTLKHKKFGERIIIRRADIEELFKH